MIHILNSIFDKIYVINLDKDIIKRNKMKSKLNDLDIKFSFFNALDGRKSPYKEVYEEYLNKKLKYDGCHNLEKSLNKKVLTSYGSLGILKTMEKIFEESINCNYKRILTLQDDVIFDNNFNSILEEYINNTPNDWKILSFGVSQHMWSKVNILKGKYYYNTPYYTDGAFAIGFDSSIYKYIINEIKKFNCNFDSGPIRSIYKKYPNKCYTLYPNIIIADLKNSNTQKDRDMKQYAKIFKWKLENFIFKS